MKIKISNLIANRQINKRIEKYPDTEYALDLKFKLGLEEIN